jgi:hypothetical protein
MKSASKRKWTRAAMAYVERLCLGSPDVGSWASARLFMRDRRAKSAPFQAQPLKVGGFKLDIIANVLQILQGS